MQYSNVQDQNGEQVRTPRRRFVRSLSALIGGAFLWRASSADAAVPEVAAAVQDPRQIGSLPAAVRDYPAPTQLPTGYRLIEVYSDPPDGLGGAGEIAYQYVNAGSWLTANNPLDVFIAPQPVRRTLVGDRKGQPVTLTLASGESIEAEYHDGWWAIRTGSTGAASRFDWETTNVHSLTLRWRGKTITVRGARLGGIEYADLLRVASSLT